MRAGSGHVGACHRGEPAEVFTRPRLDRELAADYSGDFLERDRLVGDGVVHRFECEEATVRVALDDAAPLYRDAPEAREAKEAGDPIFENFMLEVLPHSTGSVRQLAADLIITTMTTVGKEFSETPRSLAEIEVYAVAMADMFCAYISSMANGARS